MPFPKHGFQCVDACMDKYPPQRSSFSSGHCFATCHSGPHDSAHLKLGDCGCRGEGQQAERVTLDQVGNHGYRHTRRGPMLPDEGPVEGVPHLHHRHGKRIVLVKNTDPSIQKTIVLRRRMAPSFSLFLDDVSELMQCFIRKLYTLDGHKIDSLQGLVHSSSILVCVGREPFRPLFLDSFQKSLDNKLPKLVLKSSPRGYGKDQEYKKNVDIGPETKKSIIQPRSYVGDRSVRVTGSSERSIPSLNSVKTGHTGPFQQASESVMDDVEKKVLVNKDGSLSMEMKVRFRLLNDELLHWSTEIRKSTGTLSESFTGHDDSHHFQHSNRETCSEIECNSTGEDNDVYITKLHQKPEELYCQHCCSPCHKYDFWKNPVPLKQGTSRHTRTSSSSGSSRKIVCKKVYVDTTHAMSSEENTEQVVEKACNQQNETVEEKVCATLQYCTISHCSSCSEECSISSKTKNKAYTEENCENIQEFINNEKTPDSAAIVPSSEKDKGNGQISQDSVEEERTVFVEGNSSQVLLFLMVDQDQEESDYPSSDSTACQSNSQENDKENVSNAHNITACKSPVSPVQWLLPKPPSKGFNCARKSKKKIKTVDKNQEKNTSTFMHRKCREETHIQNTVAEERTQTSMAVMSKEDNIIIKNDNVESVETNETEQSASSMSAKVAKEKYVVVEDLRATGTLLQVNESEKSRHCEMKGRMFDEGIETSPSNSDDSVTLKRSKISKTAPKKMKEKCNSVKSMNSSASTASIQSRVSEMVTDESLDAEDQTVDELQGTVCTGSQLGTRKGQTDSKNSVHSKKCNISEESRVQPEEAHVKTSADTTADNVESGDGESGKHVIGAVTAECGPSKRSSSLHISEAGLTSEESVEHLGQRDKCSLSHKSERSRTLNIIELDQELNKAIKEKPPCTAGTTQSNKSTQSNKTTQSICSKKTKVSEKAPEEVGEEEIRSVKTNISERSEKSKVSDSIITEFQDVVEKSTNTGPFKSNVGERSIQVQDSLFNLQSKRSTEDGAEKNTTNNEENMSTKSSASKKAEKYTVSEVAVNLLADAESDVSMKSMKFVVSDVPYENVEVEPTQNGERSESPLSRRTNTCGRSVKSKALEVPMQELEDNRTITQSTISIARSNKSKTSDTKNDVCFKGSSKIRKNASSQAMHTSNGIYKINNVNVKKDSRSNVSEMTCDEPPDDVDCSRNLSDSEYVPFNLPHASPTEVVNEWLKKIPSDHLLYHVCDEFHNNCEEVETLSKIRHPKQNINEKGSEDDLGIMVFESRNKQEVPLAGKEMDTAEVEEITKELEFTAHNPTYIYSERDSIREGFHTCVQVMKVLLSPRLERCNSLPEISPARGQKLSTSARRLLECFVNLQLTDFDPGDVNGKVGKYNDLMNMFQSFWLRESSDSEPGAQKSKAQNKECVDNESKPRSFLGIDVSNGSLSSEKCSGENSIQAQKWQNSDKKSPKTMTMVQEINNTEGEKADFELTETSSDLAAPDVARCQVQCIPRNETKSTEGEKMKQCNLPASDDTVRKKCQPIEILQTLASSNRSSSSDSSVKQEETDTGSTTPSSLYRAQLPNKSSQIHDPVCVVSLLQKLEKQFMRHYVNVMAEFKLRWNLNDNEQIDAMICELGDEVHKRIQSIIDKELRKIQEHAGRPKPPKEAMSRQSTPQGRRRLKATHNQSIDPKRDDVYTTSGTDFSDQRSSDDYCPCDTCMKKKMLLKPVLPHQVLNSAPLMRDFDLRNILQLKREGPTKNKENIVNESKNEEQNTEVEDVSENVVLGYLKSQEEEVDSGNLEQDQYEANSTNTNKTKKKYSEPSERSNPLVVRKKSACNVLQENHVVIQPVTFEQPKNDKEIKENDDVSRSLEGKYFRVKTENHYLNEKASESEEDKRTFEGVTDIKQDGQEPATKMEIEDVTSTQRAVDNITEQGDADKDKNVEPVNNNRVRELADGKTAGEMDGDEQDAEDPNVEVNETEACVFTEVEPVEEGLADEEMPKCKSPEMEIAQNSVTDEYETERNEYIEEEKEDECEFAKSETSGFEKEDQISDVEKHEDAAAECLEKKIVEVEEETFERGKETAEDERTYLEDESEQDQESTEKAKESTVIDRDESVEEKDTAKEETADDEVTEDGVVDEERITGPANDSAKNESSKDMTPTGHKTMEGSEIVNASAEEVEETADESEEAAESTQTGSTGEQRTAEAETSDDTESW